ncbi:hypothetical protein JYT20_00655 [Rhodothermus sp. AH-315-K08]|nr:hypothetical protein [Rhodothermus sp. AH-315-K08]
MSFCSQPFRASRFQKGAKYPALLRLFLLGVLLGGFRAGTAGAQVSEGLHLVMGPAAVPGVGVIVGAVAVGRMLTREVSLAVGYRSSRDGSVRAALTFGGAIRALGVRRTIFGTSSRGVDVDLGLRLGPAVLFRFEESDIERNKRFTLVADPFVRIVARKGALFFLEFGIHRPALRAGLLISL